MTLIPPKLCVICRTPFTPRKRSGGKWSQTCGHGSCKVALARQSDNWRGSQARATAARRAQAQARRQAELLAVFGEFSERERAIVDASYRAGYKSGYTAAMKPLVKRPKRDREAA